MKLLVVRDHHTLVPEIQQQLEGRVEDISCVPLDWQLVGETVDIADAIKYQKPDFVLMLTVLGPDELAEWGQHYRQLMDDLTNILAKSDIPLIYLSSAAVYPGQQLNYLEHDAPDPVTDIGRLYLDIERMVESRLERYITLRSGWMFSESTPNFMTSVIEYASSNAMISVNSAGKGCPTAMHDIARVILAILLQADLDIGAWGTYHYSSSDAVIGFQFIETILAQAAQFDGDIDPKRLLFEHCDSPLGDFYFEPVVLECSKLKDTFGIHQKPWRAMLGGVVRAYFSELEK
ncbi:dTDP-4-dehydrorhamnose reductase [BD1-7 clade bacterium]|uniref:dTDP-4-dehydrorhamnose reductase n=1 Tax=BD1-7 clade bacterium TaxID=2029982 RepID=A0A5S9MU02_9GAMM|nr:dTDP-4-dehydrorhamnose reductase [BD1-7 clade bacterium]